MTRTDTISSSIQTLTPGDAWSIYVGQQTVAEFLNWPEQDAGDYVADSPLCRDLGPADGVHVERLLVAYIDAQLAYDWGRFLAEHPGFEAAGGTRASVEAIFGPEIRFDDLSYCGGKLAVSYADPNWRGHVTLESMIGVDWDDLEADAQRLAQLDIDNGDWTETTLEKRAAAHRWQLLHDCLDGCEA